MALMTASCTASSIQLASSSSNPILAVTFLVTEATRSTNSILLSIESSMVSVIGSRDAFPYNLYQPFGRTSAHNKQGVRAHKWHINGPRRQVHLSSRRDARLDRQRPIQHLRLCFERRLPRHARMHSKAWHQGRGTGLWFNHSRPRIVWIPAR